MTTDRTFRTLVCLLGILVLAMLAGASAASAAPAGDLPPSISSDKADYAPGEVVVLTGARWQPGESVHVNVNDDHGSTWSRDIDLTADADGVVSDSFTLPDWFVAEYTVRATGASGATATWTFTDGNVKVSVVGATAAITETLYNGTGCTSSIKSGPTSVTIPPTDTVGVGSSESLRLDAPAAANGGQQFLSWTKPSGSNVSFTPIAGTNGRSVCVAGFQSGSEDITANYATNTAPTVAANNASVAVDEGQTAANSGTYSDANTADNVTITASRGTVTKTGTNSGTWSWSLATNDGPDDTGPVTITANDGHGGVAPTTFTLNVNNVAPTVSLSGAASANEGDTKTYTFSVTDPGQDTFAIDAGFPDCDAGATNNGTFVAGSLSLTTTGGSFQCFFSDGPSTANVKIQVRDSDGASTAASQSVQVVNVANVAPTVTAPANQNVAEGNNTSVSLGAFSDPGPDSPWAVDVDWGDGSAHTTFNMTLTGTLGTRTHTYADGPATRTVSVKVTDKNGASDTKTFTVTVGNVAPKVTFDAGVPSAADEGQTKTFSYSISDPGADTVSAVDTSCGTGGEKLAGETHTDTAGSFQCKFPDGPADPVVSASATDSDGALGAAATQPVHISNVAPTVHLTGEASVDEGTTHTYAFTVSDPGVDTFDRATGYPTCDTTGTDGQLVAGSYTAGATGGSFQCSFPDGPATADVKIKVADSDGASTIDSESVTVVGVVNVAPILTAAADQNADEGTPVYASLGSFTDPGADTWTVDLDWGDGATSTFAATPGTLPAKPHTFDDNGTYTVKVKVTDKDNASDTKTFKVTVANLAPSATLTNDGSITEGGTSTIAFSGASDPSNADTAAGFHYAFHCDGSPFATAPTYAGATPDVSKSCSFADDGTYTVRARILDKDDGFREYTTDVVVKNAAPAVTAAADQNADEGASTSFDLGSFTDAGANDTPWAVDVDWGDSSPHTTFDRASQGSIGSRSHTYADGPATRTVTIKVTDKDGASDSQTFTVTVKNVAPTVTFDAGVPSAADEGQTKTFSYTISDPGADTVDSVDTSCGDNAQKVGADSHTNTTGSFQCKFPDGPSDTTVSASAMDFDGAQGAAATQPVHVSNVAPKVVLTGATNVDEGSTHAYTFTVTDPGQDTFTKADGVPTCDTTGNDGTLVTGSYSADALGGHFECSFPDGPATADVKMKVVDSDGDSGTDSESVTVVAIANVPAAVTAPADQSAKEGAAKAIDLGSFADPGTDSWTADVDWDDGHTSSFAPGAAGPLGTRDHTYDDNGAYTVSVKVTDKDNGSDTKTFKVTVDNVAPTAQFGNDGPIVEGSAANVSFSAQSDPSDADTTAGFHYAFHCDGSAFTTGPTYAGTTGDASKSCDFADDGTYSVRARILDKDGGFTEYTTDVVVTNTTPVVTAPADQSSDEGETKSFDLGSFTDAGANDDPWAVDVDWGDGSAPTTFSTTSRGSLGSKSHTYADDGTYTVKVSVTDKDHATGSKSFQVAVKNVAPTVTLSAGNAQTVDEGTTSTYTYSIHDPGDDTVSAVSTDCGDDGQKVGASSHTNTTGSFQCLFPDGPADSKVSASATDSDGAEGAADSQTVHVNNVAPKVMLNGDTNVDEGTTHTYTFTVTDPGQDTFTGSTGYPTCDTIGTDGTLVVGSDDATAAGGSFRCSFPDGPSTADVRMRVADSDGASGTDSESVTVVSVANVAPVVTPPADQSAEEGASTSFQLGSFADAGADTWTLDVDWGDGTPHTGGSPAAAGTLGSQSHAYADNGTYTVSVTVTDEDDGTDTETFDVTVDNVAPVVTTPADHTADEGTAKDFGLGSFSDPGANDGPWGVDVAWGDGSPVSHSTRSAAGSLGLANHAYDDNGTYTVSVKVTDKDGAFDTMTYKVAVANVAPTATLTNDGPITEGGSATIAFSGATDASAADVSAGFRYAIRCDGGTPAVADATTDATRSCSFDDNGSKTVKGIVVDKDGGAREYTTTVVVNNAPPVVTAAADQTADEGTSKAFDLGSFGDAGAGDGPWPVDVDWGDGSAHTTFSAASRGGLGSRSHTYADNGIYTVKVKVADKDGASDTKTFKVTVANVAPKITEFSGTDYIAGPNAFLNGGALKSTLTTKFTDPGADIWTGLFTYADGAPLTESITPFSKTDSRTHTFASAGCKTASVKVSDDDGGSDTASTTVKVSSGTFQPPMTNQPVTDKLKNGQVLPVKVRIMDCTGVPISTLAPAIRLVKGDLTPQNDDAATSITPTSSSAADTTGVMRSQGGGDYMYNLQVNLPTLNTDYTVVIYPYGTSSLVELGHVIQATK